MSDADGKVAKSYGVYILGYADRVTFVIAPGGKVAKVIEGKDALDPSASLSACPVKRKPSNAY